MMWMITAAAFSTLSPPVLGTAARAHDGGTQKMRHDRVLRSEIAYICSGTRRRGRRKESRRR